MRFFYTEPLAAAWQAKHFGMKLLADTDDGKQVDAGARFIDCDDTFRELWQHDFSYLGKLYVASESLHMLEPQPKDLVFYEYGYGDHRGEVWDEVKAVIRHNDEGYPYTGNGEAYVLCDGGESFGISRLKRIIQRQGKPFHWPESEAA